MWHTKKMPMNAIMESVGSNPEGRSGGTLPTWFISSAVVILVVTGLAKVWAGLGHTKVMAVPDPITGLSFGHLMLAVGVGELVIASICLFANAIGGDGPDERGGCQLGTDAARGGSSHVFVPTRAGKGCGGRLGD
jgi:hypothetical protein